MFLLNIRKLFHSDDSVVREVATELEELTLCEDKEEALERIDYIAQLIRIVDDSSQVQVDIENELDQSYDSGYIHGKEIGYDIGYEEGYKDGKEKRQD